MWPHSLAVSTTAAAAAVAAVPVCGSTLNVKSPRSPSKPEISKVYVPAVASVRLMNSGLVPVSTVCRVVPAGSLMARMKSVEVDGTPSTVARMTCPAVAVNGMLATGCAAVISPVVSISGAPKVAAGATPMPAVPFMIACDLRW